MTPDPYYTGRHVRAGDLSTAFYGGARAVAWGRRQPNDPTPAMIAGSALHCAILEPEEFVQRYAVKPEGMSLATKDGKAWAAEHAAGRQIIPADVAERGLALAPMFRRVAGHGGAAESCVIAEEDGISVACKPDWLRVTDDLIDLISVKSTKHATPGAYQSQFYTTDRYPGYDLAEAHYLSTLRLAYPDRNVRLRQFVIPTGSSPRFAVVEIDPADLDPVDALRRRLTAEAWAGLHLDDHAASEPQGEAWTLVRPRWSMPEEVEA
jgi:hypothetical protein